MPDVLRPLFDQVVIKELEPDRMRKSGLLVPQGSNDAVPPNEGIVLAVGEGPPDLPDFKMPVKPGDHVVFPRSAGVWVEVEDERLLVCRVREILGVIEDGMSARDVQIRGDMIRLGELLKLAGVVDSGGEAKALLATHRACCSTARAGDRRGRQLHPGDEVRLGECRGCA